jgi:hypothetical protein
VVAGLFPDDGRLTDNSKPIGKLGPVDADAFAEDEAFAGACVLPADLTLRTETAALAGLAARYTA